ncbi:hypothetical protein PAMP_024364 [Pampus punctatissimus]
MPVLQKDAQRALELLQQYRAKLDQRQQSQNRTKQGSVEEDHQLQQSLDRVINVFQSQLFSALLDIQEYYELTVTADSKCSVDQIDSPGVLPASCDLPAEPTVQPQPTSGPLSPQASVEPSKPKRKSIKSRAPPIPSATPTSVSSSPTTQSTSPQSQLAKVKYRAPLPPVQSGACQSMAMETSTPSSSSDAISSGITVNGIETSTSSSSIKTPTQSPLNGTKPHFSATNSISSESSNTSASLETGPAFPELNLVTVSALVSSTIQGLVSPTTVEKLTPTISTPSTSPGPNRVTDAAVISTALTTSKDPGIDKVTPSQSPTSPNQGKVTFGSRSPTGPPGLLSKGPHLSPTSPGPTKVTSTSPTHGPASPKPAISPLTPNKRLT